MDGDGGDSLATFFFCFPHVHRGFVDGDGSPSFRSFCGHGSVDVLTQGV